MDARRIVTALSANRNTHPTRETMRGDTLHHEKTGAVGVVTDSYHTNWHWEVKVNDEDGSRIEFWHCNDVLTEDQFEALEAEADRWESDR